MARSPGTFPGQYVQSLKQVQKPSHHKAYSLSLRAGILVGIGFVAAIDELVFHQLLGWHHFYDLSTPFIGLVSDGILHAAELICMVAGFMTMLNLQRSSTLLPPAAFGGFLCGVGGFQLFDGIVNHKILQIHQIRYGVDILPYDILWNLVAVLFLTIGIYVVFHYRKRVNLPS